MTATLSQAISLLQARAVRNESLAEAVCFLAQESAGPADPFGGPGGAVVAAARSVNRTRQRERAGVARANAVDTAEAIELISSIHDRRGIDRRRSRGQLLGWKEGRRTLHPAWQFDRRRGDTRAGLEQLLEALAAAAPDPLAADTLMTAARADLDGATLADLFAAGQVESVVRMVRQSADQS